MRQYLGITLLAPPLRSLVSEQPSIQFANATRERERRTPPADCTPRSHILLLVANVIARSESHIADRSSHSGPAYGLALRRLIADLVDGSYAFHSSRPKAAVVDRLVD